MSEQQSSEQRVTIDPARVMKVYTGRAGACMCGCAGSWRVASAHRAAAEKSRGYSFDDEQVSDLAVKRAVARLVRNPETKLEDGIAWVNEGKRTVAAYLIAEEQQA